MKNKHYELTAETKVNFLGITLFRIKATIKSDEPKKYYYGNGIYTDKPITVL